MYANIFKKIIKIFPKVSFVVNAMFYFKIIGIASTNVAIEQASWQTLLGENSKENRLQWQA